MANEEEKSVRENTDQVEILQETSEQADTIEGNQEAEAITGEDSENESSQEPQEPQKSRNKKPKKKKDKYKWVSILLGLAFSFNLFVFAPFETYISNTKYLWFGPKSFLIYSALLFVLSTMTVYALCRFLPKKARNIVIAIFTGLTVGLYVQGNYLNTGYGLLTGDEIPWGNMVTKGLINVAVWLVILAVPIILLIFNKKLLRKAVKFISVLILGIEIFTVVYLTVTLGIPTPTDCYLTTVNQFNFSKEQNIVLIVADTFETDHMKRALEEFPEIKEDLKDFIYYPNTTGVSTYTYLSMATLMTDKIFPLGTAYFDGLKETFEETDFFDKMHAKGFDVNFYTDLRFFKPEYGDKIDNLPSTRETTSGNIDEKITMQLYQLSLFRYMPHFLKKPFYIDSGSFSALEGYMDYPVYTLDDIKFNNKIKEGFKKSMNKKQYSMYHLGGLHAPIKFDRNLQDADFNDNTSFNDRRYEAALGEIKILKNFINGLKANGTYDQTTIVYTSDHGNVNRYNVVFMVKPANADAKFKVSNAPISVAEDLIPFIIETADGKVADTKLLNIPENKPRKRYVYNFYSNDGYANTNNIMTTIEVDGDAGDPSAYYLLKDDYTEITARKNKYKLGQKINFDYKANNAKVYGFREEGWAWSRTAKMEIQFSNRGDGDLTAKVNIESTKDGQQRLIVKSNGVVLYDDIVFDDTKNVEFGVPGKCFDGDKLEVNFEFPDTNRNTEDIQGLEWMFYESFQLKNIVFSK